MKAFIIVLCLSMLSQFSVAQDRHDIDSLKPLLATAKEDTNKVNLLNTLGYDYIYNDTDTALVYLRAALPLAQKLSYKKGEITSIINLGLCLGMRGDYPLALSLHLKALRLAENLGNRQLLFRSIYANGYTNMTAGHAQKSLDYFYQLHNHLAEFKLQNDNLELLDIWTANAFLGLNKLDSAQYFITKVYPLELKANPKLYIFYFVLARLAERKGEYQKAINYMSPFRNSMREIDRLFSNSYLSILYLNLHKTDSAIIAAKNALAIQKKLSMADAILPATITLTEIYATRHQPDSALKYQTMMLAMKDSLYGQQKAQAIEAITLNEQQHRQELTIADQKYKSQIRIYVLSGVLVTLLAIGIILWRNNHRQKLTNLLLSEQKEEIKIQRDELEKAFSELKNTQNQLIQREKMASLGELTAGIAHEIQNPLNFVNNFSDVNREMLVELQVELDKGDVEEAKAIAVDIEKNEQKINHHGKRADSIVKGMLEHSRVSSGQKEPIDINALADEYLRLAYHGLRAKDKAFNAKLVTNLDEKLPKVDVVPQDIGRVMLNVINNAFYATQQKAKSAAAGYKPAVEITTARQNGSVIVSVKDNGDGIPDTIKEKIMQPFFTTKPTGEGTGLGLSLSYDIVVKGHAGNITVNTKEGEFTEFIITLPVN